MLKVLLLCMFLLVVYLLKVFLFGKFLLIIKKLVYNSISFLGCLVLLGKILSFKNYINKSEKF